LKSFVVKTVAKVNGGFTCFRHLGQAKASKAACHCRKHLTRAILSFAFFEVMLN
jgi:hypothetical protein